MKRHYSLAAGKKNRRSNGLARMSAHPRPPKTEASCVWHQIHRVMCFADTLKFSSLPIRAPLVSSALQGKVSRELLSFPAVPAARLKMSACGRKTFQEQALAITLQALLMWVDQDDIPDNIRQRWQEVRANKRIHFKVGDFKERNVLTAALKADSIQLSVKRYLAVFSSLKQKQDIIAGWLVS